MSSILKRTIYLDNGAATPVDLKVLKEIARVSNLCGNPSSFNNAGRESKDELQYARLKIARFLGAQMEEVIFTSSGSESNNLAIYGFIKALGDQKGEIITTPIEHLSVLEPLRELERLGWKITYLKVNNDGAVSLDDLKSKLNPKVRLVSVMYANNEIGTIQPINKISKIIKENSSAFFYSDACQAAGYLDMNVNNLGIDLMTFNGTKLYGPRGIAVLYKRKTVRLSPIILGGSQENGLRAGTENLPAILGIAKAITLINNKYSMDSLKLRDYFIEKITRILPEININGPMGKDRLPNNVNFSVPGLTSEVLLLELDKHGIYASSGSACTTHSVEPSHVLKAIGIDKKYLDGALRFTLGRQTTKKDIDYVLDVLPKVVGDLRKRYNRN